MLASHHISGKAIPLIMCGLGSKTNLGYEEMVEDLFRRYPHLCRDMVQNPTQCGQLWEM